MAYYITDAVRESLCLSLQRIGKDGLNGFLKQKGVIDSFGG